jgi:Lon protease-like protein
MLGRPQPTPQRRALRLPLFPLKTVLFPGGLLPLKVFEQRYIAMVKTCVRDAQPFGVVLITRGDEVASAGGAPAASEAPQFASIGTLATIGDWDMPQPGILHVRTNGGARFQVKSHALQGDGLVVGEVTTLPDEPAVALAEAYRPLSQLVDLLAERVGPQHFPDPRRHDDASWVGYRLAELLPLPLSIKQSMLEINDAAVRLSVLRKFLAQHGLL